MHKLKISQYIKLGQRVTLQEKKKLMPVQVERENQ